MILNIYKFLKSKMKLSTFYNIYYKHRIKKAKFFNRIYLLATIIFRFFYVITVVEKKINIDKLVNNKKVLFNKNLNYLFQFFNSDKGFYYLDQYSKKIQNKKVKCHAYSPFYEKHFYKLKEKKLNILELGSFKCAASAAFRFYFKNSTIYSADLYPDLQKYFSKK